MIRSKFHTNKGTELPILNMKGKEYLEVKYRLVWFREERPEWRIETEFAQLTDKHAIAKATIRDKEGGVVATSHKREDAQHFPDFMEKAETGAIGRALAICGFGTQFCADELDEGERIVDSPAGRPNPHAASNNQPADDDGDPTKSWGYTIPFGKWQKKPLEQVHREFGINKMLDYCDWLVKSAQEKGRVLTPPVEEFIQRVKGYARDVEGVGNGHN